MSTMSYEMMVSGSFNITKSESVNKHLENIANAIVSSELSTKDICRECYALREDSAFTADGVLSGMKYSEIAQNVFGKRLSSASCVQYASLYDSYVCADSDFVRSLWDEFNTGKLSIMAGLENKKNRDKGMSIENFFIWYGEDANIDVAAKHDAWMSENAAILDKIAMAENAGMTEIAADYREKLSEEPKLPVNPEDESAEEEFFNSGYWLSKSCTDSVLKEMVRKYRESFNKPNTDTESADTDSDNTDSTESTESAESTKTEADYTAECLAAVIAYQEHVEHSKGFDTLLTKVIEKLRS